MKVKISSRVKKLTGRFGRLTIIRFVGYSSRRQALWLCRCKCGNKTTVISRNLTTGDTQSCGCYHQERLKKAPVTHGRSRTKLYCVWSAMIGRCHRPADPGFKYYGARGIAVCSRWRGPGGFENFFKDMGEPPTGGTLERRRNNNNYTPKNCLWATRKQQARNKSSNRILEFRGRKQCLAAWAEESGICPKTLQARLNAGNTVEEAITRPVRKYVRNEY